MKNENSQLKQFQEPWLTRLGQTIAGCGKLILKSRRAKLPRYEGTEPIIIMGNGPSLADTIKEHSYALRKYPTIAVNFAANTNEFQTLQPHYYILADPHFFDKPDDPNVARLIENIQNVGWKMTIFLPFEARGRCRLVANDNLSICYYNAVGIEGFQWFTDFAYKCNLGMPRPRNVLIPAIMVALGMGYKEVYVVGADHTWSKTLSVDEDNRVVSIQPHFYKEDEKEVERIRKDYISRPLHSIFYSYYVAFRAYFVITDYAERHNCKVFNSTPNSFIDALPRNPLPKG